MFKQEDKLIVKKSSYCKEGKYSKYIIAKIMNLVLLKVYRWRSSFLLSPAVPIVSAGYFV